MGVPEDRKNRAIGNMIKGIIPPVTIGHPGGISRQNNRQFSTAEIKGFGLFSGNIHIRHINNQLALVLLRQLHQTQSCNSTVNGVPDGLRGQEKPDMTVAKRPSSGGMFSLMTNAVNKKAGKTSPNRRIKAEVENSAVRLTSGLTVWDKCNG